MLKNLMNELRLRNDKSKNFALRWLLTMKSKIMFVFAKFT